MSRSFRNLLAGLVLLIVGCAPPPAMPTNTPPAPTAPPTAAPPSIAATPTSAARTRIVEPTTGWPRTVETPRGIVTIKEKPRRIHTLSIGLDEITFALVDPSRIAAVGKVTTNPNYSNVADLAAKVPNQVGRDAEDVLSANPDLVMATPFAKEDLVKALQNAGVTVVVVAQPSGLDAHEESIRLLAYLYGEEQKGEQLIGQIHERLARIDAVVEKKKPSERPRVLILIGNNYTAGAGSNEDGIIRRAGGVNVAAEAGIKGNKQVSLEAIPAMKPDLILLVEQDSSKRDTQNAVLTSPALQDLPAIKEKHYALVKHSYVTTLSHWNVHGVEQMARIFYPNDVK